MSSVVHTIGAPTLHAQMPSSLQLGATPEARLAISEFQATWQTAWFASENYRRSIGGDATRRERHLYFHCHAENFQDRMGNVAQAEAKSWGFPEPFYEMIASASTAFGVCPTWLRSASIPFAQDESRWRDGALLSTYRESIARSRRNVIMALSRNLRGDSTNAWLRGQLTRLLIDARDFDAAASIATACSAPAWWCAGLRGQVHLARGDAVGADSAYAALRRAMTSSERCAWDDLSDLLEREDRVSYRAVPCGKREELNERIWWLADPLLRIAGNERRVEQESRRMSTALRASVLQDERYPFDSARGGDAVAMTLSRFGWPVYAAWGGTLQDREHSDYLSRKPQRTPSAAPYTTFEYTLDAVSTIPSWRIISSPFESHTGEWRLHPEDESGRPSDRWWPQEHFRPARRLLQLPTAPHVFIRRHDQVEIASALRLAHPEIEREPRIFDVMLLASPGPGRVDSIANVGARDGSTVYLRGFIKPGPALLAIEALGIEGTMLDARTREGAVVPAPLSAMNAHDVDLSDIALLSPLSDSALRNPNDELLERMLPSARLPRQTRQMVLYWETYGVRPADSATTSITIVSQKEAGLLRRLGMFAGLASDPRHSVSIEWKDREPRGNTTTLNGPVPVQMRTLQLNLRSLEPGPYVLEVAVRLADGRTANRRTSIVLEP